MIDIDLNQSVFVTFISLSRWPQTQEEKELQRADQTKAHTEPHKAANVGNEAGDRVLLIPDQFSGESLAEVHVDPGKVVLAVIVQVSLQLGIILHNLNVLTTHFPHIRLRHELFAQVGIFAWGCCP